MSDNTRTISKFIRGLQLIEDAVVSTSFYNSSGGDAGFRLNRELHAPELAALTELGFWDYSPQLNGPNGPDPGKFLRAEIAFSEWSDPR